MEIRLDTVPVSEWGFFDESIPPLVIAGPCSAESELQVMLTAKELSSFGLHVFRAGIWKPRTHPGSFEGVGTQGLKWLQKVKREFGMKVGTEVASEKHVYECIKYGIDIFVDEKNNIERNTINFRGFGDVEDAVPYKCINEE